MPCNGSPEKCISCGRWIITTGENPQCMACHDFELDAICFMTDPDGVDIDYDSMTYAEYLRSDHWSVVRGHKIREADGKCAFCGSTLQLHVHHREYPSKRLEIRPSMLVVLCKRCHSRLHD